MNRPNHIAIIPARKNSKGLKFKNRLLFDNTAKFVKSISFFDQVIVATDDKVIGIKAKNYKFNFYNRLKKNAKDSSSIKSLIEEVVTRNNLNENSIIWLLYTTLPLKIKKDFLKAFKISNQKKFLSLISFREVLTHPYDCWSIKKKVKKFFKNNIYRRQDKPKLFEHHHYLCALKIKEIKNLNKELINQNTKPIILPDGNHFLEIDTKQDYKKYQKIKRRK